MTNVEAPGPQDVEVRTGAAAARLAVALPCEFGRRRRADAAGAPPCYFPAGGEGGRARVVLAESGVERVSRVHFVAERLDDRRLLLANRSERFPLQVRPPGGGIAEVAVGSAAEFALPCVVECGPVQVAFLLAGAAVPSEDTPDFASSRVAASNSDLWLLRGASRPPRPPSRGAAPLLERLPKEWSQRAERLGDWLRDVAAMLHGTLATDDFVGDAVRAVVERLPFEFAEALLRQPDGAWRTLASHPAAARRSISRRVLDEAARSKSTTGMGAPDGSHGGSLHDIDLALAAPILDAEGNAIGALAGVRRTSTAQLRHDDLDAVLLELLAGCVAVGLARQRHQRDADALRTRFEQFFTRELAEELARNPAALAGGAEREVTLLFADIRGFSRISAGIGPARTVQLVNAVMTELSVCVQQEAGVLVNYLGDELFAMWGAPGTQPDHAARAVRAAQAMLRRQEECRAAWSALAGAEVAVGIGVNTGLASVGNTGSQAKFQYGALGDAVNVASRVQGLTRPLRCPLLVSGATRAALPPGEFRCRRALTARLSNLAQPVDVHVLEAADAEYARRAEDALAALEAREFERALRTAGKLLDIRPDGAVRMTALRAADALLHENRPFNIAWEPPGK